MKIAVIPDAAMIVVNMINKYGHEYLSSTNLSTEKLRQKDPYDEAPFDESLPPFNMTGKNPLIGNKYTSNETPSGLRGRMSLFDNIIQNSDAAIIIGNPPLKYSHMYDTLNELILFGCVSCGNLDRLVVHLLKQKNMPILELAYPTTQKDLEKFIQRIKEFLLKLDDIQGKKLLINDDNLNIDLRQHKQKIALNEFEEIINERE